MYVAAYGVGGLKNTLAKVRKAVHKVIPRELSPTRLLEKYATDSKKKGAAKLRAVSNQADARDAAAQAAYEKQVAAITALAPVVSEPLPFAPKLALAMPAAARPNYVPYIAAGAGALLLLLAIKKRKRR